MEQLLAQWPTVLLVACRISGVTFLSPVFQNGMITVQVRVFLGLFLGLLIGPLVPVADGMTQGAGLLIGSVLELLVGLLIGFMSQLIFAVVQLCGALMDMDAGFVMAQIYDPHTGHADPLISTFMKMLAITLYFLLNGHHWLIRALAGSYETVAAGGLLTAAAAAVPMQVVLFFGQVLQAAVQITLPYMAVMLLTTAALAGVNRAMPQMNLLVLGLGLKSVAGLALLFLLLPFMLGMLESLFSSGHSELLRILGLLQP